MLRGSATAILDKKGRIVLPAAFRKAIEQTDGEVFVTSMDDKNVRIYPLTAWLQLVGGLDRGKRNDPLQRQFLMKTNYNGQKARIDKYGRIQIHGFLRKKIKLEGKIAIEEREDYLELIRGRM
jgi:division/cell wall cluster transcriptional repressor MraZ